MDTFEVELGALADLAKDLVQAGQRAAASKLLKASIEPLQKSFDETFLVQTAEAAKAVARARGLVLKTETRQQGNERRFIFKVGDSFEVEHLRQGHLAKVNLRQLRAAAPRETALAKAISLKLQRVYASMGDRLLAKTAEALRGSITKMAKGSVLSFDPSKRRKAPEAPAAGETKGVVAGLRPPNEHLEAMEHHARHVFHHDQEHLKALKQSASTAALHERLSNEHHATAVAHAKRIGRSEPDVNFMRDLHDSHVVEGLHHKTKGVGSPKTFVSHPADASLAGRQVAKQEISPKGLDLLAKALKRRRPPRTKRALGRHKRTQGVWSTTSKVHGKQTMQTAAARSSSQAQQQGSGILSNLLNNLLGS